MKQRRSPYADVITVAAGGQQLSIQPGTMVDLDMPFGGETLEAALGERAGDFIETIEPSADDVAAEPAAAGEV